MLVTRPILLHLARIKFERASGNATYAVKPQFARLSTTCKEAADRALRILFALKQQQLLGKSHF